MLTLLLSVTDWIQKRHDQETTKAFLLTIYEGYDIGIKCSKVGIRLSLAFRELD